MTLRSAPRALGGLGDRRRSPYSPLPYSFTLSLAPTVPVALCLYPAEVSPSFSGTARKVAPETLSILIFPVFATPLLGLTVRQDSR